ncbi:MAG TPA: GNAT family N-acetyltransferase [Chitinophagaceae bacterium]|nr:GNAT family N-acetyltransferase [Chitinophagaceae bacterium]HPH31633.1 GNAT family N-acetyltransferase [Chitinophagaceae bacterium]HPN58801.1 GNAT family N-acetyltransferase [Chitinophagaceae bacterium]
MTDGNTIQYLTRLQIDTAKWDQCISRASNGRIYAFAVYLDTMSANWDALVLNDYEAVMPLTWNSKYGIQYLYQPFLAAQLGVFGSEEVEAFIEAIPGHFRYIDIYLNSANTNAVKGDDVQLRDNYVLALHHPYEKLVTDYRENIRRNIKKAKQAGCIVEKGFEVETVITLATAQMQLHDKNVEENTGRFRQLYQLLKAVNKATTYGISLHGEMIASCVFFFSNNRAYYILVGNHPNGKTIGASHALIDAFIADHAGQNLLLDFEGSDIRNLAFFYSSFGATQEIYPALKINRLPFYLRWLKK